jgi:hypothetical protein
MTIWGDSPHQTITLSTNHALDLFYGTDYAPSRHPCGLSTRTWVCQFGTAHRQGEAVKSGSLQEWPRFSGGPQKLDGRM